MIRLRRQKVSGGKCIAGRGNRRSKCMEVGGNAGHSENGKDLRMASVSNSRWEGAPDTQVQNIFGWKYIHLVQSPIGYRTESPSYSAI